MDTFKEIFMTSKKDATKTNKRQLLIQSGKDSHHGDENTSEKRTEQVLIGSGKDSKRMNEVDDRHARLNQLYDELRTKTAVHVDKQRNAAEVKKEDTRELKNSHLELVKKDMVDLLNSLQSRETFTYHDGKFALQEEKDGAGSAASASEAAKKKEEDEGSKLAVVESLLEQLKSLEGAKKREQKDAVTKKEILKENEQKKREESTDDDTAAATKRLTKIFKDAFESEMEKRKTEEKKKTDNDVSMEKGSLRDTLVQLMSQLDKRIADEKTKVEDDEKQISQLEKNTVPMKKDSTTSASGKKKSFEEELDSILSDFSTIGDKDKKRSINKVLEGFNIDNSKTLSKGERP